MEEGKETLFEYLEWADTTPEVIAAECYKVFKDYPDDWERFKEAVDGYK